MGEAADRQLLDRLVREHLTDLMRLAVRLTGDLDTAEDVVQDALAAIARSWSGFRDAASFRTWATRIVVNAFRDRLRRDGRSVEQCAAPLDEEPADRRDREPHRAAEQQELGEQIARLVSSLPARQREVLVLVVYEQMPVAEVAAMLEMTAANVHSTLYAARQRLARDLGDYLGVKRDVGNLKSEI
jgi:RNA polymerase sigma-70 factor, ECF subfamily